MIPFQSITFFLPLQLPSRTTDTPVHFYLLKFINAFDYFLEFLQNWIFHRTSSGRCLQTVYFSYDVPFQIRKIDKIFYLEFTTFKYLCGVLDIICYDVDYIVNCLGDYNLFNLINTKSSHQQVIACNFCSSLFFARLWW